MEKALENLSGYKILLASHSPRRRELLGLLGIEFELAETIEVDEGYPAEMQAEKVAAFLSAKKSSAYRSSLQAGQLVITADTVVIIDNRILGKPKDLDEAREMLHTLSGRPHRVITGVTLATIDKTVTFDVTTQVNFSTLTYEEIDFYVDKFRPLDKAGAYGIQEWIGAIGVKSIEGSYYNVMGLPLHRLYTELSQI